MREPCGPNILYNPNYTALSYRGRNLSFVRLQAGLDEVIADTWNRLLAFTGNTKIKVELPDPDMSEDVRSTDMGESFIDMVKTSPPTLPLLSEMFKRPGASLLRPTRCPGDGVEFEVDPGASQEFLHKVKPIIEAIAFLIQVTGSGPLRLSEVVDDRYRNGSSPRNLLISHGLVFLLRRNLKPSGSKGHRSSIIHFPPPKVAELIIYYLAVVRPVEVFLVAGLGWADQLAVYSEFLYVVKGRKLASHELSELIARYTDRYFGCRLGGLDLRHVLINIQAVFLPPTVDPSVQKFRDSQAGHSTRTANHVYGQQMDNLPGEQASCFVLSYHWCRKLHTLLGLGPEVSRVRPIPFLHAPPEPTWWSPSDYIPPHPVSLKENMSQMRLLLNSALSGVTDEVVKRCGTVIRETIFQAIAASSSVMAPHQLPITQPPPPIPDDPEMLNRMPNNVSFRYSFVLPPLILSSPHSQTPHPHPPRKWRTIRSSTSCPFIRNAPALPSPATTNGFSFRQPSQEVTTTSSPSSPLVLGSPLPYLDPFS